MMERRTFLTMAAGGLLAAPLAAEAQPEGKVWRSAADPVASGFVASLARPGGNITGGTSLVGPGLVGKRLELLQEAVPKLSRVAVLSNPTTPDSRVFIGEAEVAARSLKVQLHIVEARGPAEFGGAFAAMIKERASAILVQQDAIYLFNGRQLAELAAKNRLPAMYGLLEHVEAGGLMAYAASLAELSRRASTYVGKILQGAKPGDLPVEQATKFDLVINLKTVKALGLRIPHSLLSRAETGGEDSPDRVLDTSPVERNAANLDDVNEPVCLLCSARTSGVRLLLMTRVAAGSPVAVGLR